MIINKNTLKDFRKDFAIAVKSLEEKYGVCIEIPNIRFSQDEFNTKMSVKNINENGEKITDTMKEEVFELYAASMGIKGSFNFVFVHKGETLQVVGINPRRPKNSMELISLTSGKKCKSSVEFVKQYFKEK